MQRIRGFTLVELMITIAVMAIVLAIAAPSFTTLIRNNQSDAIAEEIMGAIQLARTEAVRRGGFVTVCPSDDGDNCGGDWTDGLLVFVDSATSDAAAVDLADEGDRLRYISFDNNNAVIDVSGGNFLRFTGIGRMAQTGNPVITFTSHVTGCVGDRQRTINVGIAGMTSTRRTACPAEA